MSHCREPYRALPEMVEQLGLARFASGDDITLYHAKGCAQCSTTGFMGRFCILEMPPITDPLRSLVMKHATSNELKAQAQREGMVTMYEDGMRKALAGHTTFEEFCVSPAKRSARNVMPVYRYRDVNPSGDLPSANSMPPTRRKSSVACATRDSCRRRSCMPPAPRRPSPAGRAKSGPVAAGSSPRP